MLHFFFDITKFDAKKNWHTFHNGCQPINMFRIKNANHINRLAVCTKLMKLYQNSNLAYHKYNNFLDYFLRKSTHFWNPKAIIVVITSFTTPFWDYIVLKFNLLSECLPSFFTTILPQIV